MKIKYAWLLIGLFFIMIAGAGAQTNPIDDPMAFHKPRIGVVVLGGFYYPWMDWTEEWRIRESGKTDINFQIKRLGDAERKNLGGAGLIYRVHNFGMKLTFQYGKTTKHVYNEVEYETTLPAADSLVNLYKMPKIYFKTYHLSYAAFQYYNVYHQKLWAMLGGGFGITMIDYFEPIFEYYNEKSGWGFHIYPLLGLEYKIKPELGLSLETQYYISSTLKKEYDMEIQGAGENDKIQYHGSYHFNLDGFIFQAGLHYYLF